MANKVILVTGSNQGIGFAITEELLKRGVKTVYLTASNEQQGKDAVEKLKAKGLHPHHHQLEVTDEESVKRCAEFIKSKHGGLDVLINSACIITEDWNNTSYDDAKGVMNINYYAILTVQKYFFPILKANARVINMSSECGYNSNLKNKEWIARLTNKDQKKTDVDEFVEWFLDSLKNGTWKREDFFEVDLLAHRVSKVVVCSLTRVQQNEIDRNISINSVHPGFVRKGMTGHTGRTTTMEESSKLPVYVALDIDQSVKGQYLFFEEEVAWT